MNDPIADMLTRIRNALMVQKDTTNVPYSKMKLEVLKMLKKLGYISGYTIDKGDAFPVIVVTLREPHENAPITELERISKPGRRVYAKSNEIPTVLNGRGEVIVSTSRGLMTGSEARKRKIGGELICKVY